MKAEFEDDGELSGSRIRLLSARLLSPVFCLLPLSISFPQTQFPDVPPNNVTNVQDRDQMMWQLGLSFPELPPKLRDPNAPAGTYPSDSLKPDGNWTDAAGHIVTRSAWGLWNNYDDVSGGIFPGKDAWRVGSYSAIDLLKMHDGTTVASPQQWWASRRPEIFRDVCEQFWGKIPPDSTLPGVRWSTSWSTEEVGGVPCNQEAITGYIDSSRYPLVRNVPKILATLRMPVGLKRKVPVMIVIGGFSPEMHWKYCAANGWGVCMFNPGALQPDNGAGLTSYLIGLVNRGHWRKPDDWGTIAAWSWGVSRLIDFLEKDSSVDARMIGVTGHSRFGKTALVAMAYDSRIAIAFPSCGGSMGTKMNRRHWGQDVENSAWDREYHWMAGNFLKWCGPLHPTSYLPRKIELCPVDAHSLLALCAPRPVFLNAGTQDAWTDPYGIYLAASAASPVYNLLGKTGIVMADAKPRPDISYHAGDIAYRLHTGGHTDAPDWPAFFEFASKYTRP